MTAAAENPGLTGGARKPRSRANRMAALDLDGLVRGLLALGILALGAWWFYEVSRRLGTPPVKDAQGNVVVDEYQRSKDVLTLVLALVTTVIGYWFGAQGRKSAENDAHNARQQVVALTAAAGDPLVLSKARDLAPEAFGLPRRPVGTRPSAPEQKAG